MRSEIRVSPAAQRDIVEQTAHLAEDSFETAERFLDAMERTLRLLAEMPEMGAPHHFTNAKLRRIRIWPLKTFKKYLIFYCATNLGVEVVRVLHAARDIEDLLTHEKP